MNSIAHPDLLADILAYCERVGMSRAEFGIKAMRDPRFVYDLQKGRECRQATVRRISDFIGGNQ